METPRHDVKVGPAASLMAGDFLFEEDCSSVGITKLLVVGVLVHLIAGLSVFAIFSGTHLTPSINGTQTHTGSLASRLVVFLSDGLRADYAFSTKPPLTPYLQGVAKKEGVCGISVAKAPTESRPCHLAIFGGFNEEMPALFEAFSNNPHPYDHLLSKAKYAWAIGYPSVVTLFASRYTPENNENAWQEPSWYLERIDEPERASDPSISVQHYSKAFSQACQKHLQDDWSFEKLHKLWQSDNPEIQQRLKSDRLLLFVHLDSVDENGHAFGPHTTEYASALQRVDVGIKLAVDEIHQYYRNDGRTAFIFTADHGHLDVGGHGDGSRECTRTPFIAWGAGMKREADLGEIDQKSIAPLIASLLGVDIPVHSYGLLTSRILDALQIDGKQRKQLLQKNLDQLQNHYDALERKLRTKEGVLYIPFVSSLPSEPDARIQALGSRIKSLQRYEWMPMRIVITINYVLWMLYCLTNRQQALPAKSKAMPIVAGVLLALMQLYRRASWPAYAETGLLLFFVNHFAVLFTRPQISITEASKALWSTLKGLEVFLAVALLELISQAFTRQWIFSIPIVGLSAYKRSWYIAPVAVFPVLASVRALVSPWIVLSSSTFALSFVSFFIKMKHRVLLVPLMAFSIILTAISDFSLSSRLPAFACSLQHLSAQCCFVAPLFIWWLLQRHEERSVMLSLACLLPATILLSNSYEAAFLCLFAFAVYSFEMASNTLLASTELLILIGAAFFGVNGIDTLTHFVHLPSFRRLTLLNFTIINAALFSFKLITPFLLIFHLKLASSKHRLLSTSIAMSEYIAIRNFWAVPKMESSWAEFGLVLVKFEVSNSLFLIVAAFILCLQ